MDNEKAIRAAKLTLGGILEKRRAQEAKDRAPGQIAPSKYLPEVPRQVHAAGGYVPTAGLPIPRLAVARPLSVGQEQQPGFFDALNSVASLGKTAMGIKNLVSPEEEPAEPHAAKAEAGSEPFSQNKAMSMAESQLGLSESGQRAAIKDYLTTGGANLDPATTAWCAAFVNSTLQQTGGEGTGSNMARSFLDWGQSVDSPQEGDIAVFSRGEQNSPYGHVGFFKGYDENGNILVLGGNQGDAVSVSPYSPDRLLGFRRAYADGGEVADLGQAREAKQLQGFHTGMMGDISDAASERMEVHQKALDAGVFDGYEMGDVLQGKNAPMKITGRFVRPWKPSRANLEHFDRMGAKPTIIEHNGKQYIPMLRTLTGVKGTDDWQEGDAYLDGVKAMGYPKMGGLRAVKAAGGAAMFEGVHPDLQDEQGNPKDLWHGTPSEPFDEFKDEKIGRRDPGFYGRGHYLTAQRGNAEAYADPEEMQRGSVMGPLHAALKNPFVWDASSPESLHRTMRKLQDFGVMGGKDRLDPWDALKPHEIDQFMQSAVANGHDGVIRKTGRGLSEIVVFKPSAIKHRDAERFDPNDPNIYHARGGVAK